MFKGHLKKKKTGAVANLTPKMKGKINTEAGNHLNVKGYLILYYDQISIQKVFSLCLHSAERSEQAMSDSDVSVESGFLSSAVRTLRTLLSRFLAALELLMPPQSRPMLVRFAADVTQVDIAQRRKEYSTTGETV